MLPGLNPVVGTNGGGVFVELVDEDREVVITPSLSDGGFEIGVPSSLVRTGTLGSTSLERSAGRQTSAMGGAKTVTSKFAAVTFPN